MKRYLQACEIAGSIYGKRKENNKKPISNDLVVVRDNTLAAYNQLYKRQYTTLYKMFQRNK